MKRISLSKAILVNVEKVIYFYTYRLFPLETIKKNKLTIKINKFLRNTIYSLH